MDEEKLLELGKYLRETGHTQASIASQLGVSQPYVNALLMGRKAFGKLQAKKWGDLYGLSPSWLLTGEGSMLKEDKEREEEEYELLPRITEDKGRPYYDVDFLEATESLQMTQQAHPLPI
jgi:Helix-turn-helix.